MIEFEEMKEEELEEAEEAEEAEEVVEEEIKGDVIDFLLATDISKFKTPSKFIEIPRLTEVTGHKFVLEIKLLNNTLTEKIDKKYNNLNFDEDGNPNVDFDTEGMIAETLVECCYIDNKQIFKNAQLRRKFKVQSNNELVKKLLLQGERKKIYDRYKELAGFIKTSVSDIKN